MLLLIGKKKFILIYINRNGIYDKNIAMSLSTVMNSRNICMTLLYRFKLGNHATEIAGSINLTFEEDSENVKVVRRWLVGS